MSRGTSPKVPHIPDVQAIRLVRVFIILTHYAALVGTAFVWVAASAQSKRAIRMQHCKEDIVSKLQKGHYAAVGLSLFQLRHCLHAR